MTLAPEVTRAPAQRPPSAPSLAPSPGSAREPGWAILLGLLLLDLALTLLYIGNYFLTIPSGTYGRLVDIDGEDSIANWYSSVKLFTIGTGFALFAARNFEWSVSSSRWLALFPLVFVTMSMDEVVQIHEWLGRKTDVVLPGGDREGTFFHVTGIWMYAIGIPFLVFFLALIRVTRRYFLSAPGATRRFVIGILIFLSGAIGVEVLTNVMPDVDSLGFRLEVCAEELLELWGATVMLWAVYTLLKANGLEVKLERTR